MPALPTSVNVDQPSISWFQPLKDKFNAAYEGIISLLKSPFDGLSQYFSNSANPDQAKIEAIRKKHYGLIAQERQKAKPNYNDVTKTITRDIKQLVQELINEEIRRLGPPPCEYTIITLGSMARQESGPITDLEIGFLMKEKTVETYQYFEKLSQNLSDRIFLLGEHPSVGGKGFRMDEADNAPRHLRFFARNATPTEVRKLMNQAMLNRDFDKIPYEGSRPFLATPEEFAKYSDPGFKAEQEKMLMKEEALERNIKKEEAFQKRMEKSNP